MLLWFYLAITLFLIWLWIREVIKDIKKKNERNLDNRGYFRNGYNKLVHRDIAYNEIYKNGYANGEYKLRFGEYDIHHKDRNKQNNEVDNLQILTREEHKKIHNI
jgi:hypothetical protein